MPTLASIIIFNKNLWNFTLCNEAFGYVKKFDSMFYGFFPFISYMQKVLLKANYLLHLSDTMPKHVFYG
jgi:hypothetical protein